MYFHTCHRITSIQLFRLMFKVRILIVFPFQFDCDFKMIYFFLFVRFFVFFFQSKSFKIRTLRPIITYFEQSVKVHSHVFKKVAITCVQFIFYRDMLEMLTYHLLRVEMSDIGNIGFQLNMVQSAALCIFYAKHIIFFKKMTIELTT